MEKIDVHVEICNEDAILPTYAHESDAGMDIYAAKEVTIEAGQTVIVPTGLKVAIPLGYEIQVRPRSGISVKTPIRVPNSPGTIDAGYRDEVGVILTNTSEAQYKGEGPYYIDEKGNKKGDYIIRKGDRIAQFVLQRVPQINFVKVDSVAEIGENRQGGFGSSGV